MWKDEYIEILPGSFKFPQAHPNPPMGSHGNIFQGLSIWGHLIVPCKIVYNVWTLF